MRKLLLVAVLSLGACGPSAEEEEAARREAVAEVKGAQIVPAEELVLDPIRYREIERYDLYGAGCSFAPDGGDLSAVALAMAEEGYLIREGELLRFAADVGSTELPYLAREKYTGSAYSFALELDDGEGTKSGEETMDYRGTLTVRDASDREIYRAKGLVQCGA